MDKRTRETLGNIIEQLIAILDALDGDPDQEDDGLSEEVSDQDENRPNLWIEHARLNRSGGVQRLAKLDWPQELFCKMETAQWLGTS